MIQTFSECIFQNLEVKVRDSEHKKDYFGKSSGFPNLEGGLKCLNLRQRRLRKLVLGLE